MKHYRLKPSPRCPECGSGDYSITPFGCVCNNCGEFFIPDNWLEDASKLILKARAFIRRRPSKQKGDLLRKLSGIGTLIKRTGPMILKKTPTLFKLFI